MDLPIAATSDSPSPAPVEAERSPLRLWTVFLAYGAVVVASLATALVVLTVELAGQLARNPALRNDATAVAEITRQFVRSDRFHVLALAASAVILAAVALAGGRLSREPLATRLALKRSPVALRTLGVAVLGCAALASTFDAAFAAIGREQTGSLARLGALITSQTPRSLVLLLLLVGLAAPVAEELFFRGYVQTRLVRRWGAWPGILAGAALFALLHLDWVHSPSAFLIGVFLGWIVERTGSVRPAMVAHAVNNLLWALATFLGLGTGLPRVAHAALLVTYVLVTAAAVAWLRRRLPNSSTAARVPPITFGRPTSDSACISASARLR